MSKDKNNKCILHATGNKKYFYNLKDKLAKKFYKRFYIFLHVSPDHFLIKDRLNELHNLRKMSKKSNVKILTPSKELRQEFSYYGLDALPIQVGVDFNITPRNKNLDKTKREKIISVCTSEEGRYHYIKGIDQFSKLMKDLKLNKHAIVLGNKNSIFEEITTKKVSQKTFFKYLANSKVYVQLSRTESYNLSAVYAKRLKIPVIVSNIGGHKNNVKFGFKVNNINEAKKILRLILKSPYSPKIKRIIDMNYKDSLKRETLSSFRNSFNKTVG